MVHILHVTNGSCAFGSWTEVCIQSNIVHCSNYIMNTTRVTVWNMYLMSTTCRSTRARAVVDWIGNTCVCNKVSACLERRSIYNSHNQHTTFDRRLTCAKWSREVTTRGGKASHSFRRNRTGSEMTTLTGKSKKLQVVMGGTQGRLRNAHPYRLCIRHSRFYQHKRGGEKQGLRGKWPSLPHSPQTQCPPP